MPDWPEEARVAAIAALDTRAYHDGLDITEQQAWQLVTDILDAAAPVLAEAERQRIRSQVDPAKLDLLADWFDVDDARKGGGRDVEVQADLRRWAKLLREGGAR